jgi:hypothetical protein
LDELDQIVDVIEVVRHLEANGLHPDDGTDVPVEGGFRFQIRVADERAAVAEEFRKTGERNPARNSSSKRGSRLPKVDGADLAAHR